MNYFLKNHFNHFLKLLRHNFPTYQENDNCTEGKHEQISSTVFQGWS